MVLSALCQAIKTSEMIVLVRQDDVLVQQTMNCQVLQAL